MDLISKCIQCILVSYWDLEVSLEVDMTLWHIDTSKGFGFECRFLLHSILIWNYLDIFTKRQLKNDNWTKDGQFFVLLAYTSALTDQTLWRETQTYMMKRDIKGHVKTEKHEHHPVLCTFDRWMDADWSIASTSLGSAATAASLANFI